MRVRHLLLLLSIFSIAFLASCGGGGGSSSSPLPPPPSGSGSYTNSSLNGTYAFTVNGTNGGNAFALLGVFTADGNGKITGGQQSVNDDAGGYSPASSISGTYSVSGDGRGEIDLNFSSGSAVLRFVFTSTGKGRLIEFSGTENASGQIEKIDATAPATLSGTYVMRLNGDDNGGIYAAVGSLTFGASGNVTGILDENDDGSYTPSMAVTGSVTAGSSSNAGSLLLNTPNGPINLIYYVVDSSHIEVLGTDTTFHVSGYADMQSSSGFSTAAANGSFVYAIAGLSTNGNIIEVGRFTLDGSGNISAGLEDYNEVANYYPSVAFTGTYSVDATGRMIAQFVYGGTNVNLVGWLSSSTKGVLMTTDSSLVESGVVKAQSSSLSTASLSGNYGAQLSGYYTSNVDYIAALAADGNGNLTGTADINAGGALSTPSAAGTYSIGSNGRGTGTLSGFNVAYYAVDGTTAYFIAADPNREYLGSLQQQQ